MVRNLRVTKLFLLMLLSLAGQSTALAASATATGPAALALAAVVAEQAPLGRFEKRVIARLFDGAAIIRAFQTDRILVTATSVVCRVSKMDIAARSCELTFRRNKRTVRGRSANEIYATIAATRLAAEEPAGSLVESISMLACTISPREIAQKTGGGAECTLTAGQ
jgi:hypothetical protein